MRKEMLGEHPMHRYLKNESIKKKGIDCLFFAWKRIRLQNKIAVLSNWIIKNRHTINQKRNLVNKNSNSIIKKRNYII